MIRHYLTTAHAALLPQLRALHASMQRHCGPFRLHVLAEGEAVAAWADAQPDVFCEPVGGFLARHPEMARMALPGPLRTTREAAITQRWTFLCDLLAAGVGPVTAIDTDLWFFSSPEPVFEEIGTAGMAVLPHGFAPAALGATGVTMESHRKYGLFNAGFTYLADLAPAAELAEMTRRGPIAERDHPDENGVVIGEQGDLEILAKRRGAHVIANPAAAPGPWCANAQPLDPGPPVHFGGRPLVAYHFHSLRLEGSLGRPPQLADANYAVQPAMVRAVYEPYVAALRAEGAP